MSSLENFHRESFTHSACEFIDKENVLRSTTFIELLQHFEALSSRELFHWTFTALWGFEWTRLTGRDKRKQKVCRINCAKVSLLIDFVSNFKLKLMWAPSLRISVITEMFSYETTRAALNNMGSKHRRRAIPADTICREISISIRIIKRIIEAPRRYDCKARSYPFINALQMCRKHSQHSIFQHGNLSIAWANEAASKFNLYPLSRCWKISIALFSE